MFGIGDAIVRGAQDLLQNFFWTIMNPLMMLINSLLDSLLNGVLGLNVFEENTFLSGAFNCSLALMFLIIPVKIIYEIVTALVKDDEAGLDVHKKIGSAFFGIVIACSLTVAVTQVINPLVQNTSDVLLGINMTTTNEDGTYEQNFQIGDTLIETVLISFGGMPKDGEYGATSFVEQYNAGELNITERYEEDTGNHEKYEYVWDVGLFMCIIGLAIYVILLFVITIQIAVRMIAIGFYYIIGPLCCTSLTNYQNPQAFNVWKSTMIGQWAQNLTQIFLLALMVSLLDSVTQATAAYPIACAALYFGAFSLILSAPNFVQAMIGGYSAGILETMNQIRGGFGMASGIVAGAVGGLIGRSNSYTGHLQGGLRGKALGNVQQDGTRRGGVKGAMMGQTTTMNGVTGKTGGVRGALFGNDTLSQGFDGTTTRDRSSGLFGMGTRTSTTFDRSGQMTEQTRRPAFSAFRGSQTTTFDPTSGQPSTVRNPSPVAQRLSSLNNRTNNFKSSFMGTMGQSNSRGGSR